MSNDEKLKGILCGVLGVRADQITDSFTREDADAWDSLNHINLIASIEEEFGATIPTDAIESLRSVSAIKAHLSATGISFEK